MRICKLKMVDWSVVLTMIQSNHHMIYFLTKLQLFKHKPSKPNKIIQKWHIRLVNPWKLLSKRPKLNYFRLVNKRQSKMLEFFLKTQSMTIYPRNLLLKSMTISRPSWQRPKKYTIIHSNSMLTGKSKQSLICKIIFKNKNI